MIRTFYHNIDIFWTITRVIMTNFIILVIYGDLSIVKHCVFSLVLVLYGVTFSCCGGCFGSSLDFQHNYCSSVCRSDVFFGWGWVRVELLRFFFGFELGCFGSSLDLSWVCWVGVEFVLNLLI